MGKGKKMTTNEFIYKSNIIHCNKYDYSKTKYTLSRNKVIITCPIHGDFEQIANYHISGNGCFECGRTNTVKSLKTNIDKFILNGNKIHTNKYDYSLVSYINAHTKIKIICPTHGIFEQTPKSHIGLKSGCPKCYKEIQKYNSISWKKDAWINVGLSSINYNQFNIYFIKCSNETETFYKIGRTFNDLHIRFQKIPYNIEIINHISSDNGAYIFDLEKRFKSLYKKHSYIPKIKFGGMYECFK